MYFDQMKTIFENWKISAKILEIQKFDFDKKIMLPAITKKKMHEKRRHFRNPRNTRFWWKFSFFAIFEQKLHFMKKRL